MLAWSVPGGLYVFGPRQIPSRWFSELPLFPDVSCQGNVGDVATRYFVLAVKNQALKFFPDF